MFTLLGVCFVLVAPDLPKLSAPTRDTDKRVYKLYDESVRNDKARLAAALDDIWKAMPDPAQQHKRIEFARQLIPFITLESPAPDARESIVGGGGGRPIHSMLLNIGLPIVPYLLEDLALPLSDEAVYRKHRDAIAFCIYKIYEQGGEPQKLASERIRLYAEKLPEAQKKQVLSVLESPRFKPPANEKK